MTVVWWVLCCDRLSGRLGLKQWGREMCLDVPLTVGWTCPLNTSVLPLSAVMVPAGIMFPPRCMQQPKGPSASHKEQL